MQNQPNYQQYPPAYQQYQAPGSSSGGTSALAIVALIISVIAIILAVVLNLSAFSKSGGGGGVVFEVGEFSVEKTESDFTYSTWIYYEGDGVVTTEDVENNYLVVMKITLLSGGSDTAPEEQFYLVEVIDGEGDFTTYDSGYENYISKPHYDFTIVGYIPLEQ